MSSCCGARTGRSTPPVTPVYLPGLYSASQPRGKGRQHITQKPVSLLADLVRVCPPGGTILDPFAGSGSTGVAAIAAGHPFAGIEASDHYARIARQRLIDATHHQVSG